MDSTTGSVGVFDSYHRHPVIIGNIRIPLFFRFTQNPNSLTFTFEKQYEMTQTIGGYVFEHWGRKPIQMHGKVLFKKDSKLSNIIGANTRTTNFDLEDHTFNPELMTFTTLFNIDQRKLKETTTIITKATDAVFKTALGGLTSFIGAGFDKLLKLEKDAVKFAEPGQASAKGYLNTMTDSIIYYKGCIYTGFFTKMSYAEDGFTPFYNEVNFDFLCTGTTYDWIDTMLTQTAGGRAIASLWGAGTSTLTLGSLFSNVFK